MEEGDRVEVKKCVYCGTRKATKPRGLCDKHYAILSIRNLYPAKTAIRNPETMEELEALIAKWMPTMPTR